MYLLGGAGIAQWWERSPPTNVARVRFPNPASYVGRFCCWFSSLLRGYFSGFSGFPPFTNINTPKFQFDRGFRATMKTTGKPVIVLPYRSRFFYPGVRHFFGKLHGVGNWVSVTILERGSCLSAIRTFIVKCTANAGDDDRPLRVSLFVVFNRT